MMVILYLDLKDVNWGKYAIDEIISGARKLNRDNPLLNITLHGCPALLEIRYFDSVDTGFIQLDPKALPRIKHYNKQILSALVKANSRVDGGRITFGIMKIYVSVKGSIKHAENLPYDLKKDSCMKGRNWIFEELAQRAEGRIDRSMKLHAYLVNETSLTEERKKKLFQTHRSVEKLMLTVGTVKILRYIQKNEVEGGGLVNETVSCLDNVLAGSVKTLRRVPRGRQVQV
ncbi:uncharacterized protein LOC119331392 [Triticum dicoccoides]|uniref:uncharacterized protein LOC119331392 n=1 Tax=Triticum dicoccoides TaxID=85692 RepID=UPI001891155C|nr:uncharacterized protein LOC119331392 [Triticum dicoccoides]